MNCNPTRPDAPAHILYDWPQSADGTALVERIAMATRLRHDEFDYV